ncbi:SDR family oxidoreductase [Vibrio metschnikovii]|uniref:SDR family oxidoreductase n=1 Tax=Vibrio metschnikovii TaxID=28172 RepID=UPI001C2F85C3|nr:SDR family oxidoreductase [Vibrio metschnikovii]
MKIKSALILITSANSLLGSTLAMHFARLGANVILCDTDHNALVTTWQHCYAISHRVHYYTLPDRSPTSIHQLFDYIETTYHSAPDVLINHWPSVSFPSLVDEQPTERFIQQLANMASSLFTFGQTCSERMRQHQAKGVIVNLVWHNTTQQQAGMENTNSMVAGFTQSWARELTPYNIRVGGVIPMAGANHHNLHWAEIQDELIRNTEYIVTNDYFSGRVMSA